MHYVGQSGNSLRNRPFEQKCKGEKGASLSSTGEKMVSRRGDIKTEAPVAENAGRVGRHRHGEGPTGGRYGRKVVGRQRVQGLPDHGKGFGFYSEGDEETSEF